LVRNRHIQRVARIDVQGRRFVAIRRGKAKQCAPVVVNRREIVENNAQQAILAE
jgi:hypothetical protein